MSYVSVEDANGNTFVEFIDLISAEPLQKYLESKMPKTTQKEEKDHEHSMARSELKAAQDAIKRLQKKMKGEGNIEAWVQSKITRASEYLDTAADYLDSGEHKVDEATLPPKLNKDALKASQKQEKIRTKAMDPTENPNVRNVAKSKLKPSNKVELFPTSKVEEVSLVDKILQEIEEDKKNSLHKWFNDSKSKDGKPGWVNVVTGGTCASDEPGEGTPKCVSSSKRASMTKAERLSASKRKKAADPGQQAKSGAAKPTYVSTDKPKKVDEESDIKNKSKGKKDACYHKVKSKYDVWPSAYASGALVKCRKVGASNWGNKSEEYGFSDWKSELEEKANSCWKGYKQVGMKKKGNKMVPNCIPESIDYDEESICPFCGCDPCECEGSDQNEEISEAVRVPAKTGNLLSVTINWRGKYINVQLFFPNLRMPTRDEIVYQIQKIYPDSRVIVYTLSHLPSNTPFFQVTESTEVEIEEAKKSEMPCNKPKAEAHGSGETGKSHVVKACEGGKEKLIRFGQRGVKGSPKKKGESEDYANRRHRFQARHAKNIAKGKMSAAYWANKVKW